jgi:Predicted metal-binding protein
MSNYNIDDLIKEALESGFSHAGALNMEALIFMPEVREMCNVDRCHKFGKSWTCPPACGTLEAITEKAAKYTYGLIVQTTGEMEDEFDAETTMQAGADQGKNFIKFHKMIKDRFEPDEILPMGSGGCSMCKQCTYPDAPCRFPELAFPSMEAYGLWVSKVCEESGIPYYYGPNTITYTSCFLFK